MRRSARELAIRMRVRAERFLHTRLYGPIGGQIPGPGWSRSVIEHLYKPAVARHVVQTWIRTPATVEHYDFPAEFPPYFRRTKAFDERQAYRLRDVVVSPYSGLVWLPTGPALEESYGSLIRSIGWGDIRSELLKSVERCDRSVIAFPGTGYYHWLLEIVPAALFGLSVAPDSWLLLSDGPSGQGYVAEAAEMLAPGRVIHADGLRRVNGCIVSAIDPFSGFVQAAEIQRIRSSFPCPPRERSEPTRLYVSRLRDRTRAVRNEAEIEEAMRDEGLAVVYPQTLSFRDQIDLFSSAELIVAPHGAGLANVIWAERLQKVIEIFPADYLNDVYARITRMSGAVYMYVVCKPDRNSAGVVPLEAVRAALFAK
jgi:capsular polysaccharide biosynthesis protein